MWLASLLGLILTGFGATAYQLHRNNEMRRIDHQLEQRVAALSLDVRSRGTPGPPPSPGGPEHWDFGPHPPPPDGHPPEMNHPPPEPKTFRLSSQTRLLFNEADCYFVAWSRDGALITRSSNAPPDIVRPQQVVDDPRMQTRTRGTCREVFHFTELGDCVLSGVSMSAELKRLQHFVAWLVFASAAILGLGIGGTWILAGRVLRPVQRIGAAAGRISAGHLSERIDLAETDSELGQLASVLNATFARLESAFAQQKQFTADAAHELRTPVAIILSEAQTTLARERTVQEYRMAVESCLNAAQQMRRIIQSLLALARFDAGQVELERAPFDLAEIAKACIEILQPLADEQNIRIVSDLASAPVTGDADRFSQVVVNILTNAITYNRDGGEIHVSTREEEHAAVLAISDTGTGISPADLPHVFERFYRADRSHEQTSSHVGLGLAICKAIVDAHVGRIDISSSLGSGTTVTVQLPT